MFLCKYCGIREVRKQGQACGTCQQRLKKALERKEIHRNNQYKFKLSPSLKEEIRKILDLQKEKIKKTNRLRYLYTLLYFLDYVVDADKRLLLEFYFKVKPLLTDINHFIEEMMIKKGYDKIKETKAKELVQNKLEIKNIDELWDLLIKLSLVLNKVGELKEIEFSEVLIGIDEDTFEDVLNLYLKYKDELNKINKDRYKLNKEYYETVVKMLKSINNLSVSNKKDIKNSLFKSLVGYNNYTFIKIQPLIDLLLKIRNSNENQGKLP